jgi:hypothetical protein
MEEPLPWGVLGDLSPWAILALTVIALILGRLIPIRTHEREIAAKDAIIADLKSSLESERSSSDVLSATNHTLAQDIAAPIAKIMGAIQEKAEEAGDRR